jgi:hypothetical protein
MRCRALAVEQASLSEELRASTDRTDTLGCCSECTKQGSALLAMGFLAGGKAAGDQQGIEIDIRKSSGSNVSMQGQAR